MKLYVITNMLWDNSAWYLKRSLSLATRSASSFCRRRSRSSSRSRRRSSSRAARSLCICRSRSRSSYHWQTTITSPHVPPTIDRQQSPHLTFLLPLTDNNHLTFLLPLTDNDHLTVTRAFVSCPCIHHAANSGQRKYGVKYVAIKLDD